MHIAVTGATGFIGRPLVDRLRAEGHHVLALVRRPEAVPWPEGVRSARFDAESGLDASVLSGVDAVIHLAGETVAQRWTDEAKRRIRDSRVKGTEKIARACATSKVRLLLSASAVGYYGSRGDEILTEESAPGDDFLAKVCVDWERACEAAAEAGVRVLNARIGMVLHPSGGALARMLLPFKLGLGGRMGSGRQYLAWIHRDDLFSLFSHCLTQKLSGPVNATAPNPVRNADFARALGRALHRPAILPVPAFALKLSLGEMGEALLGSYRAVPKRALDSDFTFRFEAVDDALADLFSTRGIRPPG